MPYAALVISGGYVEAGDFGRWRVEAGDVLAHGAFDAHQNWLPGRARVLNLDLAVGTDLPPAFRATDPDAVVRAAGRQDREVSALLSVAEILSPLAEDWPDALAAALILDPGLSIGAWARDRGLSPTSVSRGFRRLFGLSPSVWRVERRARSAWRDLASSDTLADIAQDHGYADQAHLCRDVRALTGATPGAWRRAKSLQDAASTPH